jgi:methylated-DNA-protein-cysteine methyltransferase-like protein
MSLSPLSLTILSLIRSIPKGQVATYGQIATLAGNPRAARHVARLLHSHSKLEKLPWHRVINSKGSISLPMNGTGGLQRRLLIKEGLIVDLTGAINTQRKN